MFGVISTQPIDASFYMENAPQSLLVQSRIDPKRRQSDGWGVGWFEQGRPRVFKSSRLIYRDRTRLRRAARQPRGGVLIGHVRWASNPLKLPRHQLIGLEHTQPFTHGSWLFAHNGTLYIPREVQAALGPWSRYVKGHNDSEVLFYWLMKTLLNPTPRPLSPRRPREQDEGGRWASRLRKSLQQLDAIWARCRKRYPLYPYPYHGLNWVLTNGRVLLVFCYVNPRGFGKAKALCDRCRPYYQLYVKHTLNTFVIASEPLSESPAWQPMKHGQLVVAEKKRRKVIMRKYQVV